MRAILLYISASLLFCILSLKLEGQIISAPDIACVSTNESSGDVVINWTLPVDSCGTFVGYVIMGATSINGPYQVIDTITDPAQTSFVHVNANGTILDWYYYMVTIRNCTGYTSAHSDTVKEEPLYTPKIKYVTVANGGIEIYWDPSSSSQTYGYIIYYDLGGGLTTEVDTVYGRTNSYYFDSLADPSNGPVSYLVITMDGCGNKTAFNGLPHRTIFLTSGVNGCEQKISLGWTPYINWQGGVSEYQVWLQQDNNAPAMIAQLSGTTTSYEYNLNNLNADTICITVKAVNGNGNYISTSNEVCNALDVLRSTKYNYLTNVTVTSDNQIDLNWVVDTSADVNGFIIKRGTDINQLTDYDNYSVTAPISFTQSYSDNTAEANANSYIYEVVSVDRCQYRFESQKANTILLQGSAQKDGINHLEWNAFNMGFATVSNYIIYREIGGNFQSITSVPPTQTSYDENIAQNIGSEGSFCYLVEADYQLNLPFGFSKSLTSRSNVICIEQDPIIYMPNAFVPNGVNNEIKPVVVFGENMQYSFKVFDRWGKKLFETNAVNVGWRGENKGEKIPAGGYVYLINLQSATGKTYEKRGTFLLIR